MSSFLIAAAILVPLTAVAGALFSWMQRRASVGQHIRTLGFRLHRDKAGTPTMGGLVLVALWGLSLAALHTLRGPLPPAAWAVYVSAASFGAVGLTDDVLSQVRRRSAGLSVGQKLGLTAILGAGLLAAFPETFGVPLRVPFSAGSVALSLPVWGALGVIVFVATTNSMNLTDGQDGLATGISLLIGGTLLAALPGAAGREALIPLLGALLGFLWVNVYPARLFLGDVGAFALGGGIAALALANGLSFVLPLFAGVLVLEAASVLIQVATFRLSGRRLLRMSPLHHHFEAPSGPARPHILPAVDLREPTITIRLWIVQALCGVLAVLAIVLPLHRGM